MTKVLIAHDFLGQFGGAERVVEEMCMAYPDAPVYTSYYAPDQTYPCFRTREVHTSFLDRAPGIAKHHKAYLPLYPIAFMTMRLPDCDVVLSSSTSFAKGIRIPEGARHICYCNTPMRFAWDFDSYVRHDASLGWVLTAVSRAVTGPMRRWDIQTNDAVDLFLANSENIARRIKRLYDRDSIVVYPPVDVDRFNVSDEVDDYYLVVSRLGGYKRVDLAVDACTASHRRLVVIGDGPARAALTAAAGATVEFRGRVSDDEVRDALSRCRALLFCGEEDFGITPVEAMASGRPVIAYGAGGALETVVDGVTGLFFENQTVESLLDALDRFEATEFDPSSCEKQAAAFSPTVFRERLHRVVTGELSRVVPPAARPIGE